MAGPKTHQQQLNIIEGRVNTKNAGKDFNAEEELARPDALREAYREGQNLRADPVDLTDPNNRSMIRGESQESRHRKDRPDDGE